MRESPVHPLRRGLFAVICALTVSACGTHADESSASGDAAPQTVRYDVPALTGMFPAIGKPTSAAWLRWDDEGRNVTMQALNSTRVEAVIKLTPDTTDALLAQCQPTDAGRAPTVQDILRPELPDGPYLTGDRLDQTFGTPRSTSVAYLDPKQNTLVLESTSMRG
jgi:ABC-type Fe3+-hydroxamate transport system substrate-binding protein